LISFKFTTDYDHVTHDVPRTFKVKVTALHDVSAAKECYKSGMGSLTEFKPRENYPTAQCNT